MVKTQLRVYYGLRGLRGKALDHAVKRDMVALEKHNPGMSYWRRNSMGLPGALLFSCSEEGARYWIARNIKL